MFARLFGRSPSSKASRTIPPKSPETVLHTVTNGRIAKAKPDDGQTLRERLLSASPLSKNARDNVSLHSPITALDEDMMEGIVRETDGLRIQYGEVLENEVTKLSLKEDRIVKNILRQSSQEEDEKDRTEAGSSLSDSGTDDESEQNNDVMAEDEDLDDQTDAGPEMRDEEASDSEIEESANDDPDDSDYASEDGSKALKQTTDDTDPHQRGFGNSITSSEGSYEEVDENGSDYNAARQHLYDADVAVPSTEHDSGGEDFYQDEDGVNLEEDEEEEDEDNGEIIPESDEEEESEWEVDPEILASYEEARSQIKGHEQWTRDQRRLHKLLAMRGLHPLMPSSWSRDFLGVPVHRALFAPLGSNRPVVICQRGSQFRGKRLSRTPLSCICSIANLIL